MTTFNECNGFFGYLFGHRFRARYSTTESVPTIEKAEGYNIVAVIEASKARTSTYEGDVCERCGQRLYKYNKMVIPDWLGGAPAGSDTVPDPTGR